MEQKERRIVDSTESAVRFASNLLRAVPEQHLGECAAEVLSRTQLYSVYFMESLDSPQVESTYVYASLENAMQAYMGFIDRSVRRHVTPGPEPYDNSWCPACVQYYCRVQEWGVLRSAYLSKEIPFTVIFLCCSLPPSDGRTQRCLKAIANEKKEGSPIHVAIAHFSLWSSNSALGIAEFSWSQGEGSFCELSSQDFAGIYCPGPWKELE